jgi:hypothetical protein
MPAARGTQEIIIKPPAAKTTHAKSLMSVLILIFIV